MMTPSQLYRINACVASETLPHSQTITPEATGGTVLHAFLTDANLRGHEAALAAVPPEHREAAEALGVDRLADFLDPSAYAPEVAFALDLATGQAREIGRGLSREQAAALCRPGEMPGIADLVGLSDDAVIVVDYKTGWGDVERADANLQVRTYALMAAKAYGRTNARCGIARVRTDGSVWTDWAEMDELDLDAHEAELRALAAKVEEVKALPEDKRPQLVEGSHCRYCPALSRCPAKAYLLRAALDPSAPLAQSVEDAIASANVEQLAAVWERMQAATQLLERLEAVLKDRARQSPIPLGGGYVLGENKKTKERIVPERAKDALARLFPSLGSVVYGESAETKVELTKAALKAALRKFVLPTLPGAKITKLDASTLEALRTAGAVSVATYTTVEAHKPKPAALPEGAPEDGEETAA